MSIAAAGPSEAAIAGPSGTVKIRLPKVPPKRLTIPVASRILVPEPR